MQQRKVVRKPVEERKRPMPPGIVHTSVKFPEEVHDQLRRDAFEGKTTLNEIIVARLRDSLKRRPPARPPSAN